MRGCATRGASGALTLPSGGRPAIRYSGVESLLEGHAFRDCSDRATLNVGSDAAETDQTRQGWKAATVRRHFWVPSGYLTGVG